jgi:hypothetical protein
MGVKQKELCSSTGGTEVSLSRNQRKEWGRKTLQVRAAWVKTLQPGRRVMAQRST